MKVRLTDAPPLHLLCQALGDGGADAVDDRGLVPGVERQRELAHVFQGLWHR